LKLETVSYRTWKVISEDSEHLVTLDFRGWHCDCEYYNLKKKICKHIYFVREHIFGKTLNTPEESLKLRRNSSSFFKE
jgi:hypothetical protein